MMAAVVVCMQFTHAFPSQTDTAILNDYLYVNLTSKATRAGQLCSSDQSRLPDWIRRSYIQTF